MSKAGWGWQLPPGCPEPPEPAEFDEDIEESDPEDDPSFWYRYEEFLEKKRQGRY